MPLYPDPRGDGGGVCGGVPPVRRAARRGAGGAGVPVRQRGDAGLQADHAADQGGGVRGAGRQGGHKSLELQTKVHTKVRNLITEKTLTWSGC